jgi:hypothetical protein
VSLGITEVQIIQWYVEEGAHVEEWKPLCQYQSDKAVDDVCFGSLLGRSSEKIDRFLLDNVEICGSDQEASLPGR